MWCPHCAQDVPHSSAHTGQGPRCMRCGRGETNADATANPTDVDTMDPARTYTDDELITPPATSTAAPTTPHPSTSVAGSTTWNAWQFDLQLREISRALGRALPTPPAARSASRSAIRAAAPNVAPLAARHRDAAPATHSTAPDATHTRSSSARALQRGLAPWLLMWPGTMAVTCGVVLLGAWLQSHNPALLLLGMPTAAMGLILFLSGAAWDQVRATTADQLDNAGQLPSSNLAPHLPPTSLTPFQRQQWLARSGAAAPLAARHSRPAGPLDPAFQTHLQHLASALEDAAD